MLAYSVRSSRAVPVRVMLEEAMMDPYIPPVWKSAGKGMQPGPPVGETFRLEIEAAERNMRGVVSKCVQQMLAGGLCKEQANRYLEPWGWSWAVVTGTADAWDHFFEQRCAPDAQSEFQDLANKLKSAMIQSEPVPKVVGEWHLPYVTASDERRFGVTLSAARCARVSYEPFDGNADSTAELKRYDRLKKDGHHGPFDHQAQATDTSGRTAKFLGWNSQRTLMGY